jgi:hypothetical protein
MRAGGGGNSTFKGLADSLLAMARGGNPSFSLNIALAQAEHVEPERLAPADLAQRIREHLLRETHAINPFASSLSYAQCRLKSIYRVQGVSLPVWQGQNLLRWVNIATLTRTDNVLLFDDVGNRLYFACDHTALRSSLRPEDRIYRRGLF